MGGAPLRLTNSHQGPPGRSSRPPNPRVRTFWRHYRAGELGAGTISRSGWTCSPGPGDDAPFVLLGGAASSTPSPSLLADCIAIGGAKFYRLLHTLSRARPVGGHPGSGGLPTSTAQLHGGTRAALHLDDLDEARRPRTSGPADRGSVASDSSDLAAALVAVASALPAAHGRFRVRSVASALALSDGAQRVGLLGAAAADHPGLVELLRELVEVCHLEVTLSASRADALRPEALELLARGGQRTLTLAPETVDDGLRRSIGKNVSLDRVVETAVTASQRRHNQTVLIGGCRGRRRGHYRGLCPAVARRFPCPCRCQCGPFAQPQPPSRWAFPDPDCK